MILNFTFSYFTWMSFCVVSVISSETKSFQFTKARKTCQTGRPTCFEARSRLDCANNCARNDTCKSFHFDDETQICCTDDALMDHSTDEVYRKDDLACPVAYATHAINGTNYCLRFVDLDVPRINASKGCQADGAHLVTIDNADMHLYLKNYLECNDGGSRWIDGEDFFQNDTMLTWDMKPVPYIDWKSGDPDGGSQDCLKLSRSSHFFFKDTLCRYPDFYICQID